MGATGASHGVTLFALRLDLKVFLREHALLVSVDRLKMLDLSNPRLNIGICFRRKLRRRARNVPREEMLSRKSPTAKLSLLLMQVTRSFCRS